MEIVTTFNTVYEKTSAQNAFMVCGCLYVVNGTTQAIDYKYNTTSQIGEKVKIITTHERRV